MLWIVLLVVHLRGLYQIQGHVYFLFISSRSLTKRGFLLGSMIYSEMFFCVRCDVQFWHKNIQWLQHHVLKTFIFLITCYSYAALDRAFT